MFSMYSLNQKTKANVLPSAFVAAESGLRQASIIPNLGNAMFALRIKLPTFRGRLKTDMDTFDVQNASVNNAKILLLTMPIPVCAIDATVR
jgi:hypothetical protein